MKRDLKGIVSHAFWVLGWWAFREDVRYWRQVPRG